MILCVCPSPAIDVTYHVDRLHVGDTVRVATALRRAGGKAVNVARVLHSLGEPVHVLAPAGAASGAEFAALLSDAGPDATLVATTVPTRTTVTVVDADGTATVLSEPAILDCWPDLLAQVEQLAPLADVVVVSGRLPAGAPADAFGAIVRTVRAARIPVVVDTSGPALVDAIAAGPTVAKPNAAELAEAFGGVDDPIAAAAGLAASAGTTIVLSLGADGAVATNGTRTWHARTAAVTGNPTGAGDALVAGIARALRHDATAADAPAGLLGDAVALAAAAVRAPTAGDIDVAQYAEQAGRVIVSEPAVAR